MLFKKENIFFRLLDSDNLLCKLFLANINIEPNSIVDVPVGILFVTWLKWDIVTYWMDSACHCFVNIIS